MFVTSHFRKYSIQHTQHNRKVLDALKAPRFLEVMLMARLNDPPVPPTESLDALKRRFIRQNREIARVNSTQSQRIRNLEIEISRLLAENIALREQAITAAAEAERWRIASRLGKDVLDLQSKLKAKLGEVDVMIEELGGLPGQAARRSSIRRRKSGYVQDLTNSPNDRDWRNRQTGSGTMSGEREGQDGKLPAILEDKYYPRRTLETEELRILTTAANIENEDTESPDLGPPPVAHFEVADPIVFDSARSPKRVSGGIVPNEEDAVSLPRNLEARRKRRTSSLLHDMASLHDPTEESGEDNGIQPAPLSKSSAKRKFETSEMETDTNHMLQNDGFEYSRRDSSSSNRPKPSRFTPRATNRAQEQKPASQPSSPQRTLEPRRVLASKSTNSPTKKAVSYTTDKKGTAQGEYQSPTKSTTRRMVRVSRIEPPKVDEYVHEPIYAPKTPAPPLEDMLSPPSSAIDTAPKQKSVEAAITNSVEDVLNGSIGRGSRRAKAAVSYAEPNLRDKMRRPDKKLVGAVEGISKSASTSDKESGRETIQERNNDLAQSTNTAKSIKIKNEDGLHKEDDQWKTLAETEPKEDAASPLKDKDRSAAVKTVEVRKKRTFSESEGTRSKQNLTSIGVEDSLDKAVSRLSIYDPPKSSPVSMSIEDKEFVKQSSHQQPLSAKHDLASNARKPLERPSSAASTARTRRHSVQLSQDPVVPSALQNTRSRPSSAMSSREMAGTGKENTNHAMAASKLKRSSSVQTMSQATIPPKGETMSATAENTLGSRRRSMMV